MKKTALPIISLENNQLVTTNNEGTLCKSFTDINGNSILIPSSDKSTDVSKYTKVLTNTSVSIKMDGEVTNDELHLTSLHQNNGMTGAKLKAFDEQRCQMKSQKSGVPMTSRLVVIPDALYTISLRSDEAGNRTKALHTESYSDTGKTVTYLTVSVRQDAEPTLMEL
jgi:hypothetical protein